MASALDSRASGPGSSPDCGHCVESFGQAETLYSPGASLHRVYNYKRVPAHLMLGVTLRWTSIPSRGSRNIPSRFMLLKPGSGLMSHLARMQTVPTVGSDQAKKN